MRTLQRTRLFWPKRLVLTFIALASIFGMTLVVTPAANATVFTSCTQSQCTAARSADTTWKSMNYPGSRGWYNWPNGQCNFAGGTYKNLEKQLPLTHTYREFDVYPRACGAARDAYRIIVDLTNGVVYFSPNHYTDFYKL